MAYKAHFFTKKYLLKFSTNCFAMSCEYRGMSFAKLETT